MGRLPRGPRAPSGKVLLQGGGHEFVALVCKDGSFTFHGMPAGTYVLQVSMVQYVFQPIRVDISAKDNGKVRATPMFRRERLPYPLVLRPSGNAQYFTKRKPYNFMSLFKNPMVLVMGVTLILVVVFPKMLSNMDPAEMEEMKKMQNKMSFTSMLKGQEAKLTKE